MNQIIEAVEEFLGFVPEIHGDAGEDVSTAGAAQPPSPIHPDQEMQPGQRPGMATPATHPSHFVASAGPNHPGVPWSPTLGVGEWANGGVEPPAVDDALLERPFHSQHLHDAHLAPTPAPGGHDPIPVTIVPPASGDNTSTQAATGQLIVSDQIQPLLPPNRRRKTVMIMNEGTTAVRISFSKQTLAGAAAGAAASALQGFLLPANMTQPLILTNASAIYIVNSVTGAGNAPLVSFAEEFAVNGPTGPTVRATRKAWLK